MHGGWGGSISLYTGLFTFVAPNLKKGLRYYVKNQYQHLQKVLWMPRPHALSGQISTRRQGIPHNFTAESVHSLNQQDKGSHHQLILSMFRS